MNFKDRKYIKRVKLGTQKVEISSKGSRGKKGKRGKSGKRD